MTIKQKNIKEHATYIFLFYYAADIEFMDIPDVNNSGEPCSICWVAQPVRFPSLTCTHFGAFCTKCVKIYLEAGRNRCPICRAIWPPTRNLSDSINVSLDEDNDLPPFTEDFDALTQLIMIGLEVTILFCIFIGLLFIYIIYSIYTQDL